MNDVRIAEALESIALAISEHAHVMSCIDVGPPREINTELDNLFTAINNIAAAISEE